MSELKSPTTEPFKTHKEYYLNIIWFMKQKTVNKIAKLTLWFVTAAVHHFIEYMEGTFVWRLSNSTGFLKQVCMHESQRKVDKQDAS